MDRKSNGSVWLKGFTWTFKEQRLLGVFTKFPQYKNANIANFILAVPLEMNGTNEVYNLQI